MIIKQIETYYKLLCEVWKRKRTINFILKKKKKKKCSKLNQGQELGGGESIQDDPTSERADEDCFEYDYKIPLDCFVKPYLSRPFG